MSPILQTFGDSTLRAFGFTRGSAGGAGAMTLISTQVLASTATTVTFSSIPQTYKHLQLRYTARADTGFNVLALLNFNGDSGTNYASHGVYGSGSGMTSFNTTSATRITTNYGFIPGASNDANAFAGVVTDILDYTNTSKNKTVRMLHGNYVSNSPTVSLISGVWLSTSAITSLVLSTNTGNYVAGSRFSLYGVL